MRHLMRAIARIDTAAARAPALRTLCVGHATTP
jgi:hypothetical protein